MRVLLASMGFYPQWGFYTALAAAKATFGRLTYDDLVVGSRRIMRALERCDVRFEISGTEALDPAQGPYVFVCNHMSVMETQVLPAVISHIRPTTFVAKPSLMRYPVFRRVLQSFDPIIVTRTDPRSDLQHVLEMGKRKLDAGISVIIFPQARRSEDFDPATFGSLGWRLARAAKVPMVPIALATTAWGKGAWLDDAGPIDPDKPVRFAVGAPIEVGTIGGAEAHRQAAEFIARQLAAWSDLGSGRE
ncbi:lysophospholipid acyltransferase family protein [Azospirillum sp. B2RO_4]|uniref:lysophospholipid acyltransferase family protein n=1 Tax=Azospirillum sp. B2RO_4 TaxID=3027796 RepID=UPI003DA8F0EC